jgi:hypothetical protein
LYLVATMFELSLMFQNCMLLLDVRLKL